jgi:hypothetical protein
MTGEPPIARADGYALELVLTGSAGTREFLASWLEPSEVR